MASAAPLHQQFKVTVEFERRPGGGLRAHSDAVPGFVLSNKDCDAVLDSVEPVLEEILSAMFHGRVKVEPLPDLRDRLVDAGFVTRSRSKMKAPVGKRDYVLSQLSA